MVATPRDGLGDHLATLGVLLVVSALVGARPVRIPGVHFQLVIVELFVFCALLTLPPVAAPLIAFVAVAGALFGPRRRPLSMKTAFNLGAVPVSAALAAITFGRLAGEAGNLAASAIALFSAAVVFYLVNTLLAAIVISIQSERAFPMVWLRAGSCSAVSSVSSVVLAFGLVALVGAFGPGVLVAGLVASLPLYDHDRMQRARLEESPAS